jgi:hypothetical protein
MTGGKPIAVGSKPISGVSTVNPLGAFSTSMEERERCYFIAPQHMTNLLLFSTLIPLSGVATTCFHDIVIKIRQLYLRQAACLTSTLLETGQTTANAAGTNGLAHDE